MNNTKDNSQGSDFAQQIIKQSKSMQSPKNKLFKLHFLNNSVSTELGKETDQQQKLRQYVEEMQKGLQRYNKIKDQMKRKFFKIRSQNLSKEKKKEFGMQTKSNFITSRENQSPSAFSSFRSPKISNNKQLKEQLSEFLEGSMQIQNKASIKLRSKLRTRSQLQKLRSQQLSKQKALILKFVKKSSHQQLPTKKWEDLTNIDKYLMNYVDYLRKKTKTAIQNQVFEKKLLKKTNKMEKFQDFILDEVKFNEDHRQKLQVCFKQIRNQFFRAQSQEERNKSIKLRRQFGKRKQL